LLGYLGFAILSRNVIVHQDGNKVLLLRRAGICSFPLAAQFSRPLRLIAYLPLAVAAGLLPYAYMPFASQTNPPMNWDIRATSKVFLSIDRSHTPPAFEDLTVNPWAD
jgi:hypothetical protein